MELPRSGEMEDSREDRFLNEIVQGYAEGRMGWVEEEVEKARGKRSKGKKLTKEEVWGDVWEKEMSTSFGFDKGKEKERKEENVGNVSKAFSKKRRSEEEFFETLE